VTEQLPESTFECISANDWAKERVERQKSMLVSLPKGKLEQNYMTITASLIVDIQSLDDLLQANALPRVLAAEELRPLLVLRTLALFFNNIFSKSYGLFAEKM
jgi:hypothetical protein